MMHGGDFVTRALGRLRRGQIRVPGSRPVDRSLQSVADEIVGKRAVGRAELRTPGIVPTLTVMAFANGRLADSGKIEFRHPVEFEQALEQRPGIAPQLVEIYDLDVGLLRRLQPPRRARIRSS